MGQQAPTTCKGLTLYDSKLRIHEGTVFQRARVARLAEEWAIAASFPRQSLSPRHMCRRSTPLEAF
eukprot:scaffold656_cov403-Pavlova_lutheri.AAC.13